VPDSLLQCHVFTDKKLAVGWVSVMILRYQGLRDYPASLTCAGMKTNRERWLSQCSDSIEAASALHIFIHYNNNNNLSQKNKIP